MMNASDLLKQVRKIEIKTRGLSRQIFAGEYQSAFKGRGMTFSEVRDYQYGDDIRNIDWNVTARFNKPYVKVFEEERELTVMLIIDASGSREFGTSVRQKQTLIAELSAVLSFSAIQNNDKVGVIMFTDRVEKFIPPKKGRQHILRIIRELIDFQPTHRGTDIAAALRYFTNVTKKRCTAFLISDFMSAPFLDDLKLAARKHDVIALRIFDERETRLPDVGLVQMKDAETGQIQYVDTSSAKVRAAYSAYWSDRQREIDEAFMHCGMDNTFIRTDEDYVKPLVKLFKKR